MKEIHAAIMAVIQGEPFVVVEHSYRNYSALSFENWSCQVYESDESPLIHMLSVHHAGSSEMLIELVTKEAVNYKPDHAAKIAELEKQLAKLKGKEGSE